MKIFHLLLILLLFFFISHVLSCLPDENPDDHVIDICPVCHDDMVLNAMDKPLIITRCGHTFHNKCLSDCQALRPNCPICRKVITDNPIIEEIMAKKLKDMKQKSGDHRTTVPRISSALAAQIRQDNLLGAAFTALWDNDTAALNVLCSYVLVGQNVCAPETSQAELFRRLLQRIDNADPEDGCLNTPLHYAAIYGLLDIVSSIMIGTKLINEQNKNGDTPLMLAIFYGHVEVAKMLLEQINDVDQKNVYGNTSLHLAAEKGWLDIVEIILTKTELINEQNNNGDTPLMLAIDRDHVDVAKALLYRINDVDQKNTDGYTSLHLAAQKGWEDIVEILLAAANFVNLPNKNGVTPYMLAKIYGHDAVASMIAAEVEFRVMIEFRG